MKILLNEEKLSTDGVVIFLAGIPGSGKTLVSDSIKSIGTGFAQIDVDQFIEKELKREREYNPSIPTYYYDMTSYEKAMFLTKNKLFYAQDKQRRGLIFDGTAKKPDYIFEKSHRLEKRLDYTSIMVFLYVELEVALKRNRERIRKADENYIRETHKELMKNYHHYKRYFSQNPIPEMKSSQRYFFTFNANWDINDEEYTQEIEKLYRNLTSTIRTIEKNKQYDKEHRVQYDDAGKPTGTVKRFKSYVSSLMKEEESSFENLVVLDPENFDIEELKKNCSEHLKQIFSFRSNGNVIYRGSSQYQGKDVLLGTSPTNRNPKDTNLFFHNILDQQFKKEGFAATRSNSVFGSCDIGVAKGYIDRGEDAYIIIPFNTCNYTWSPVVNDLYLYFDGMDIKRNILNLRLAFPYFNEFFEYKKKTMSNQNFEYFLNDIKFYRFDDLYQEVVVFDSEFLEQNLEIDSKPDFYKMEDRALTNVFKYQDDNIGDYYRKYGYYEIALSGKYYVFSQKFFKKYIEEKYKIKDL